MHSVQRFIKTKILYFLSYFRNEFIKIFNDLIGTRKLQTMHPEEQKEIPKNILGQDCKTSVFSSLFNEFVCNLGFFWHEWASLKLE
jgi:hypothetical protein